MTRLFLYLISVCIPFTVACNYAYGESSDPFFDDIPFVVTPGKTKSLKSETNAFVTVIDAEQISKMGKKDIPELLQMVPGMIVQRNGETSTVVSYQSRPGITITVTDIGLMIDGKPFQQASPTITNWAMLPVITENIERIEIIRGMHPQGFGRDAYQVAINFITKDPSTTKGFESSISQGSMNSKSMYSQYSGNTHEGHYRFSLNSDTTEGWDTDLLTGLERSDKLKTDIINIEYIRTLNNTATFSAKLGYLSQESNHDNVSNYTIKNDRALNYPHESTFNSTHSNFNYSFSPLRSHQTNLNFSYTNSTESSITFSQETKWMMYSEYNEFLNREIDLYRETYDLVYKQTIHSEKIKLSDLVGLISSIDDIGNVSLLLDTFNRVLGDPYAFSDIIFRAEKHQKNSTYAFEIKDEWMITPSLQIISGARVDHYSNSSHNVPTYNFTNIFSSIQYEPNNKVKLFGWISNEKQSITDLYYNGAKIGWNYHLNANHTLRGSYAKGKRITSLSTLLWSMQYNDIIDFYAIDQEALLPTDTDFNKENLESQIESDFKRQNLGLKTTTITSSELSYFHYNHNTKTELEGRLYFDNVSNVKVKGFDLSIQRYLLDKLKLVLSVSTAEGKVDSKYDQDIRSFYLPDYTGSALLFYEYNTNLDIHIGYYGYNDLGETGFDKWDFNIRYVHFLEKARELEFQLSLVYGLNDKLTKGFNGCCQFKNHIDDSIEAYWTATLRF